MMKTCKTNNLGQYKKPTWYYFLCYPFWKVYRKFAKQIDYWDNQMFFPYIQRSIETDRKKRLDNYPLQDKNKRV